MRGLFASFILAATIGCAKPASTPQTYQSKVTSVIRLPGNDFRVTDDSISVTLSSDFRRDSDHAWISDEKHLAVVIDHKTFTASHKEFVDYSIKNRIFTKYNAVVINKDYELSDNKLGTFLVVFNYRFMFIATVLVLDAKVGHSVDCLSNKESTDQFIVDCKKILESVTIK